MISFRTVGGACARTLADNVARPQAHQATAFSPPFVIGRLIAPAVGPGANLTDHQNM
jgi:hypothetical protein